MVRWILRVGSLYLALVAVSAVIIITSLKAHPWAALGTAAIAAIFKTAAAYLHERIWERLDHPGEETANVTEPAPVFVGESLAEVDVELIEFPCPPKAKAEAVEVA